jgi:hypothetical protein
MEDEEYEGESMVDQIADAVAGQVGSEVVFIPESQPSEAAFELSLPFLKVRLTWKA